MRMLPALQPGDVLLYAGTSFWSWTIKLKTWSRISHAELYLGNARTWTSRDGQGTGFYPFSGEHLDTVMRPIIGCEGDIEAGIAWAKVYAGRPYDWWGLLRFFRLGSYTKDRMFCSEAVVNFTRAAGCELFNAGFEPDQVSPGMFLSSPHLTVVWERDAEGRV